MKIHTKNILQYITGKVGQMNTARPQGKGKETQKRKLSISYWPDGACKHYNSTEEGGERKLRGLLEKREGNET
jgi:hypothetical protein